MCVYDTYVYTCNLCVGGGTHFVHSNTTYRPSGIGTAVLFSGKNLHLGVSVTSGTRYILTGFCDYFNPKDFSHECFMAGYNETYDGAAANGIIITYVCSLFICTCTNHKQYTCTI